MSAKPDPKDGAEKMSESKHTPGPWPIDQDAFMHEDGFYGGERGYHCITIPGVTDMTGFCGDANARLIASAPELLEALYRIANSESLVIPGKRAKVRGALTQVQAIARAAIAKATGAA